MKTDRGYPKEKAPSFTMRCEGLGWNPNWYPQPFVANYSKGGFQKYKNPTTESICVPWLFHMCNHWIQLVVARIFECVAACCSVMQCVAIDCRVMRVLHCAIMHGSVWQCIAAGHFECAAVWYSSVLQYVAVCLQCTVARYFDCVAVCCRPWLRKGFSKLKQICAMTHSYTKRCSISKSKRLDEFDG